MESSSGQATVPASICPSPPSVFFNDLYADIRMDQMEFYTWWQGLCCGSGSGLWRGSGCECNSPCTDCWMLCCTGSKSHPHTHWGQATWRSQCQSSSASSQHPQISSSSWGSAGWEQIFILVLSLLFMLTRGLIFMVCTQTRSTESTKL